MSIIKFTAYLKSVCLFQLPGSLEDTPLTFVDSLEQLEALKEELKGAREFAIDLEV